LSLKKAVGDELKTWDFQNFELKIAIKDLLATDQKFMQGDNLARLNSRDRSVSFGVSYKL